MPHSPLISKIRCHNPNKHKSRVCNRNYLVYIATREGVDLSEVSSTELKIENLDDEYVSAESANDLYAKYIAERPGSSGLFGNFNLEDVNTCANRIADLTASGQNIYRGIVSLSETDAIELGYDQKDHWVAFMRATMPDIASQFNIPIDKLQWTAAVHMEKAHPHCHYMFWRTDDTVSSSYIHTSTQDACREILSKEMFKAEREQEVIAKTLHRDYLLDTGKDFIEKETDVIVKKVTDSSIMGHIRNETLEEFGGKLLLLSSQLPDTGRLNYKLLTPDLKLKVDELVDDMLQEKELKKEYQKYMQSADNISRTYSVSEKHFQVNHQIADEDIRKRLANSVLKSCKTLAREQKIFDKYIDRAELSAAHPDTTHPEDVFSGNTGGSDSAHLSSTASDPLPPPPDSDIDYDNEEFVYDWNKDYKKALNFIYSPTQKDISKALAILTLQADQNNVLACMELGKIYTAKLVPDIPEADSLQTGQDFYKKAYAGLFQLESKKPKTAYEYKLGKLLEKGNGVSVDYDAAKGYYEKAASSGYKYAQYSLGNMYLHENISEFTDENRQSLIESGLSWIKASADQGFAYAAYTFAKTYEKESFLTLPDADLEHYYSLALSGFESMLSERRDDNLLYRIGTMYYEGKGTESNQETALAYFKEAADLNNANAQYALGKTYSDPESGHYDLKEAIKYFELSAKQNNAYALAALGGIYANPDTPEYFNLEKSIECYKDSFSSGNENAAYRLGRLYSNSDYKCFNLLKAVDYYKILADKGNDLASYQLGQIYANSESDYYDLQKAVHYFTLSADKGNDFACYKLGQIYANPESDYYDSQKCIEFLNRSISAGNIYAQAKLGNIYLWGKCPNIAKDVQLGLELLRESAAAGNDFAQTSIDIYEDIQKNAGRNLLMSAGYRCFRSMFATLSTSRRTQDIYADLAFRNLGKAAKKALATRQGKYVDHDS